MIADVTDDMPLRLADAAALAFPHGGMTASGLRREAAKGRLAVSRIAGKDYTSLAAIRVMIERCRINPKAQGCHSSARKESRGGMDHQRWSIQREHRLRP